MTDKMGQGVRPIKDQIVRYRRRRGISGRTYGIPGYIIVVTGLLLTAGGLGILLISLVRR